MTIFGHKVRFSTSIASPALLWRHSQYGNRKLYLASVEATYVFWQFAPAYHPSLPVLALTAGLY
jgi:hypothetical protein